MKELYDFLKKAKEKLNIDLLGVARAQDLDHRFDYLEARRRTGIATDFENKDTGLRTKAQLSLKGARSIIVVGKSYYWEREEDEEYLNSLHSSARDYHRIMKKTLDDLVDYLAKEVEFTYYSQVDSGPLLEKEYARIAGLGRIGKNTLLINEDYGSYIFLGLLVTDIEFDSYSQENREDCGNCKECVRACPTGALDGNYQINPQKCLSYLSQWKGQNQYSQDLVYAYGCDICQKVCPRNHSIISNRHQDFEPRKNGFDLEELEAMTKREFRRNYGDYSFSWIGKKRLIRNIKIIKEGRDVPRNNRT